MLGGGSPARQNATTGGGKAEANGFAQRERAQSITASSLSVAKCLQNALDAREVNCFLRRW
jgi:hypothetical protein